MLISAENQISFGFQNFNFLHLLKMRISTIFDRSQTGVAAILPQQNYTMPKIDDAMINTGVFMKKLACYHTCYHMLKGM